MPKYIERNRPPGRQARVVNAIRVLTKPGEGGTIQDLFAFLAPAWKSVEVLDHPPRVVMSHGKRKFTAQEGWWIVNPLKGAYLPMANEKFELAYELWGGD